jgi:hypothetical protein
MKFRNVKTGKPWTYSFVRGTSVEKAVELLTKAEFEMKHPQFQDENIFHVYAHPKFPKKYDFAGDFHAQKERDNLLPAKYFAGEHAKHDYLSKVFLDILYSVKEPVDFSRHDYRSFYNRFSEEINESNMNIAQIENAFIGARAHRGVLIYFNELLLENLLFADKNDKQHRRFNSVKLYSESPVNLECIRAVEPLGYKDTEEFESFIKNTNRKDRLYFSCLYR